MKTDQMMAWLAMPRAENDDHDVKLESVHRVEWPTTASDFAIRLQMAVDDVWRLVGDLDYRVRTGFVAIDHPDAKEVIQGDLEMRRRMFSWDVFERDGQTFVRASARVAIHKS